MLPSSWSFPNLLIRLTIKITKTDIKHKTPTGTAIQTAKPVLFFFEEVVVGGRLLTVGVKSEEHNNQLP